MWNNRFIKYTGLSICFLLMLIQYSWAQKKVEKLETDADVTKFVKNYFNDNFENPDPIWKRFELVNGEEWHGLYNLNRQLEDSLSKIKANQWQTVDLNFDQKQDLVVCGKLPKGNGNEYVLLAFISNEDGGYEAKSLVPEEYQTYPYYFSLMVLPKIGVPAIRLVKWFPDVNNESLNGYPFSVDTLAFAREYLVNYNARPDSALFKDIKFEALNYNGTRTIVAIDNLDKGIAAPFTIVSYNKPNDSTIVHGKITMAIYSELLSLVNYSGFQTIPNQYQSNTSNAQTFVLDVHYGDDSRKKVTDYAGGGTYTLAAIYSWFDWLINYSNQSLMMRRYERTRNQ